MVDVTLTIYTQTETRELPLTGEHLSIGRGDAAQLMLDDDGLSRLHATLHREGERVWVLDEASTNGTFVNGQPVPPAGTPLKDNDEITIGHHTAIKLRIRRAVESKSTTQPAGLASTNAPANGESSWPLPLIAAAVGIVVVLLAAIFIGSYAARHRQAANTDGPRIAANRARPDSSNDSLDQPENNSNQNSSAAPTVGPTPASDVPLATDLPPEELAQERATKANAPLKRYGAMSKEEQLNFVSQEVQHIARRIGNREGNAFTPEALSRIKNNVDAYASRARLGPSSGCHFGQSLTTTLERASKSAPFINRAFNEKGLSPVIGLYLAMIESEYCVCLTSPTGPKGMFQFTRATAVTYGLRVIEPEERCIPEKAAPAAASYMKALMSRYGTGPLSVPLSIASYNSGEGGLSSNLFKALDAVRTSDNPERSFWTMVANADQLSDQFQKENIKYVPKFFAAAIIGENPRVFGVEMEPLSTYSQ